MSSVKHIFFDLDHTLWDHDQNAFETISELLSELELLAGQDVDPRTFYDAYREINVRLWGMYRRAEIDSEELRERRFREIFSVFEYHDAAGVTKFSEEFLARCPLKSTLVEGARELLDWSNENYSLHIITNGFANIQEVKMRSANMTHYFDTVTTSESSGHKKPHRGIFEHAFKVANADPAESIYVGDNFEVDVKGGLDFGVRTIFYNPRNLDNPSDAISILRLGEIRDILVKEG